MLVVMDGAKQVSSPCGKLRDYIYEANENVVKDAINAVGRYTFDDTETWEYPYDYPVGYGSYLVETRDHKEMRVNAAIYHVRSDHALPDSYMEKPGGKVGIFAVEGTHGNVGLTISTANIDDPTLNDAVYVRAPQIGESHLGLETEEFRANTGKENEEILSVFEYVYDDMYVTDVDISSWRDPDSMADRKHEIAINGVTASGEFYSMPSMTDAAGYAHAVLTDADGTSAAYTEAVVSFAERFGSKIRDALDENENKRISIAYEEQVTWREVHDEGWGNNYVSDLVIEIGSPEDAVLEVASHILTTGIADVCLYTFNEDGEVETRCQQ